MKQSRPIEIIQPTLRRSSRRGGMPMATALTIGAAVLAIVLTVSLTSAANTDTCAMSLSGDPTNTCD